MVEAAAVAVLVARPAVVQVAVLAGMAEKVVTVARQQSLSGRRARVAEAAVADKRAPCTATAVAVVAVHLTNPEAHSQAPKAPFVSSGEPVARSPSTQANLDLGARYADDKLNSSARLDHFFHRAVLDRLGDVLNLSVSEASPKR